MNKSQSSPEDDVKKQHVLFGLFWGWCLLFVTGCASTSMTSFRDPSFATKAFHRILIVSPFADLESRTKSESRFVECFSRYAVEGISSIRVFMPTRTYTNEELSKLLSENGIDGVLLVTLADAYTAQTYVPTSSSTYGQATLSGNTINYSAYTQQYGGYYISKPRVRYDLRLYDVSTGNTAWVASSLTRGNAFARFDTLIGSLADTAVEKLKADRLLK
jgi:hypothetical protein